MLYLLVYGDKSHPLVDVILCDNHPDVTDEGTLVFRHEGQEDFYVYPGDYLSVQCAYFGGGRLLPRRTCLMSAPASPRPRGSRLLTRRTWHEAQ